MYKLLVSEQRIFHHREIGNNMFLQFFSAELRLECILQMETSTDNPPSKFYSEFLLIIINIKSQNLHV